MKPVEHETASWCEVEAKLFEILSAAHNPNAAAAIFILGAPRTGSTLFYQALCSRFEIPYLSNITNDHFAGTPIIGLALQKTAPVEIEFSSQYGKTKGALQPSEASAVMCRWFGGGHPSAIMSARIRSDAEPHFLATLAAAEELYDAPLVIKNAWNCFRVTYLAQALPRARFIWIRRDVAAAAKSDLSARYTTKGDPNEWNSATPANVEELQVLPPAAQVVENQHAFNVAIQSALESHANGRWHEIWYEDFCAAPDTCLSAAGAFLGRPPRKNPAPIKMRSTESGRLEPVEEAAIDAYLAKESSRLTRDRHPALV